MFSFILGVLVGCAVPLVAQSSSIYHTFTTYTEGNPLYNFFIVVYDQIVVTAEQYFKRSVVKDGGVYIVKYVINGRLYSIRVKPVMGPLTSNWSPERLGRMSVRLPTSIS